MPCGGSGLPRTQHPSYASLAFKDTALNCILASYPFLGMGLSLGLCRSVDFSSTGTMLYPPESRVPLDKLS